MGYTPKHAKPAKPASPEDAAAADRHHRLFAITESSKGRHSASGSGRQTGSVTAPGTRVAKAA